MDEQKLIERYIDLDTDRYPGGRADARLREYGVPVWALVGQMRALNGDLAHDQAAGCAIEPGRAAAAADRHAGTVPTDAHHPL
jgi:hypothetical protein